MEKEPKFSPQELKEDEEEKEWHKGVMEEEAKKSKEIMEEEKKEKELRKKFLPYAEKEIEVKIKKEGVDKREVNKILESSVLSKEGAISAWKQGLIENELWRLLSERKERISKVFTVEEKEKVEEEFIKEINGILEDKEKSS